MGTHQLIGAEVSYYTGKVRAYLRYKRIPFEEITATREVYKNVIIPRTGVRFIPVLISDEDVAVQDTTEIIDHLEARYPERSVYPTSPVQRLVALLFEVYGDEWLLIPAMHYRWDIPENRAFAIREFGRLSAPHLDPGEQERLGAELAKPFAGALPALGVSEETVAGIEASYLGFLDEFDAHLADHPFLLGDRPSIGDFGLLGPLYAHLYRDPWSGRLMRERASRVADWVERMNEAAYVEAEFPDDDAVPDTLLPILRRMFAEQGPVLGSTIDHLARWAETAETDEVPRGIGTHEFRIGGTVGRRVIFPFNLWMWQRPYDHYHRLAGEEHQRAERLLDHVGGLELANRRIPQRVARRNNRLVLD